MEVPRAFRNVDVEVNRTAREAVAFVTCLSSWHNEAIWTDTCNMSLPGFGSGTATVAAPYCASLENLEIVAVEVGEHC